MEKNKNYYGFTLKEIKDSVETDSKIHYFYHEKSGADLVWFKNKDDNKTFGIGFKTPPEDSTGVAHIVEHCVLSGSRKFKTREPFMELAKSSMSTFLNAMTFSDMTIYPISSMVDKDFRNLMDVYLDAVLYPQIYDKKEIFMQEGWHYELLKEEDPIIYKGVVYNEMKGAYSSSDIQVFSSIDTALHEGSTYAHESGGYPYAIPDLTYENFLAFHKKYYHPSNSQIFLYGDLDIEDTLNFIDGEYLSNFNKEVIDSSIVTSKSKEALIEKTIPYSSQEGYTKDKNSYLSYTVNLGTGEKAEDTIVNSILAKIIINSESSPVKLALLKANIGEDVFGNFDSNAYYQDLSIIVKNADEKKKDEFVKIIEDSLAKMAQGIDKNLLLAAMNSYEISMREGQGPLRGVVYFIRAMKAWLYGKDPIANLTYNETFKVLREELEKGYFEDLIKNKVLKPVKKLVAVHSPDQDLFKKEDEREKERLEAYKKSLSKEDIRTLIEENEKLLKFQMTEDSKEDKNTIPKLKLEDIPKAITHIGENRIKDKDNCYLLHPMNTSSLSYLAMVFNEDHIREEELPYLTYLSNILSLVDTKNYSYSDLNNVILMNTSGLKFTTRVDVDSKDPDRYSLSLELSSSAIGDKWKEILNLSKEVILHSLLEDKVRIKEILNMVRSNMEMEFDFSGNAVAMKRAGAKIKADRRVQEVLSGITFFDHINDLLSDFDNKFEAFKNSLIEVSKKAFNGKKVLVSITAEEGDMEEIVNSCKAFIDELPKKDYEKAKMDFKEKIEREAITSSSNVQYVSKVCDINKLGYKYNGDLVVLSLILSRDYLHNAIRARGGAYGAGLAISSNGELATFSYRDPNLESTVNSYNEMYKFIEDLNFDEDDIRSYIIGSMSKFIHPVVPSIVNSIMLARYLKNTSKEDIEKLMNEAKKVNLEAIKKYSNMLKEAMEVNCMVTFGNKEKIEGVKDLFTTIRPLRK